MRHLYSILFILLSHSVFSQYSEVKIQDPAPWIVIRNADFTAQIDENELSGYSYLLIDRQDNVVDQEYFKHFTYRLETSEGVQQMSDISISFDPSYEELIFHYVKHIRDGEVKKILSYDRIRTIQRESSMERKLFDGRLTSIINIEDVREGDIIDYAYTIRGANPIFKDHYFNTYYFEFSLPIINIYTRIVSNEAHKYTYKLFNDLATPKIKNSADQTELIWDLKDVKARQLESNIPVWYDPYAFALLSDFKNWKEVIDWAVPLYELSDSDLKPLKSQVSHLLTNNPTEANILSVIRFVQDDIRYLGFEQGMSAIKPNKPREVLHKRFGDCKDKSLLLIGIFHLMGIEAYPVLVNSTEGKTIGVKLPTPAAFDHCVVKFTFEGTDYYVDPTINNQRGTLSTLYFPAYDKGLVIANGNDNLVKLPRNLQAKIHVFEEYDIPEIDGSTEYNIRTVYYGSKADFQRSHFKSNDLKTIQKNYLDYYANLFYEIEPLEEIEYEDLDDEFIVTESYLIRNGWNVLPDDTSTIYFEFYPLMLEDYTRVSKSVERKMPYDLQYPNEFEQTINISLPEEWTITPDRTEYENNSFYYSSSMTGSGKNLLIKYLYKTKKDILMPAEVKDYFDKHDLINKNLSYYITYNKAFAQGGFKLNAGVTGIAILLLLTGSFFAFKLHRSYNPEAQSNVDQPIGGWLILIALGLIISPFRLAYDLYNSPEYFNSQLWDVLMSGIYVENSVALGSFLIVEMTVNIALLVFSVLLLIQFFTRRSSFPRLITLYLAFTALFLFADTFIAVQMALPISEADLNSAYKDIVRSFIAAAIWIPYFNMSTRVKNTFVRRAGNKEGLTAAAPELQEEIKMRLS